MFQKPQAEYACGFCVLKGYSNCWGVDNMSKGTNSNRLVVFSRQD